MTWICSRCRTRFEERRTRCPHDGRRVVEDLAGQVVAARYTLRELLGVGGMESSVWLGWQQSIQRAVAIKLLPPADEATSERFARGARIASNLNHPNITVVHDYGITEDQQLYLVMELLEGQTLHRVLRNGLMPPARTIHIIDQVLRALDNAHRKHIVHRDIKPGNLFLTVQNDDPDFVKVLDFGIARYIDATEDPVSGQEITMERQICGTPQYMAPEQVAFGQVDARTDIYALGVVMYRMLTGRLPFQSGSHHELFRMHLHAAPPPFAEVKPDLDCPADLEAVVMRALAKSPDERFASAAEMRMALRQVRNRLGLPLEPDESSMPSSSHGWSVEQSGANARPAGRGMWLAALLIGGLAVAAIIFALRPPPPPTATAAEQLAEPALARPSVPAPAPKVTPAAPTKAAPVPAAPAADAAVAAAEASDAAVAEADEADGSEAANRVYHLVVIETEPDGASVVLGRREIGRTPLRTRLAGGTYRISIRRDGYEATGWTLDLAGDRPQRVEKRFKLRANAPTPPPAAPPARPKNPPAGKDPPVAAPSNPPAEAPVAVPAHAPANPPPSNTGRPAVQTLSGDVPTRARPGDNKGVQVLGDDRIPLLK